MYFVNCKKKISKRNSVFLPSFFKSANCSCRLSVCSAFDYDTENMNSEDIYSSLKGVTEAIQNFSVRSQEDMNEPIRRREGDEVGGAIGSRIPR